MPKIPKGKRPFNSYLRKSTVNSFFINLVQESEIKKLIDNLKQSTTPGSRSILLKP